MNGDELRVLVEEVTERYARSGRMVLIVLKEKGGEAISITGESTPKGRKEVVELLRRTAMRIEGN